METNQLNDTQPPPLETKTVQMKKGDKCPICREIMIDEKTNQLVRSVLNSRELGVVHQGCFVPYMGEKNLRMLVQIRAYSIGDTVSMTPIIRELRRIYPQSTIDVMTFYPDIFRYNPHVSGILDLKEKIPQQLVDSYHFRIDGFNPDKTFHFATHSVEFASFCALSRSTIPTEWDYEMHYQEPNYNAAMKVLTEAGIDPAKDKCILIHPHGTEWETRDWGPSKFPELAKKIMDRWPDHKVVSIGGSRSDVEKHVMKNYVPIEGAVDIYGKLGLLDSAAMMDMPCMKLLVTPDTGTLHLAAARPELPIVGIFTLIKAYFRTPVRNKRFGYKFIGVESDSKCNCTYNAKFLTDDINLQTCPMKTMLKRVQWTNLNKGVKLARLIESDPLGDWDKFDPKSEKLGSAIRAREKEFDPKNLPCFPSVDKVFKAVESAMEQWG